MIKIKLLHIALLFTICCYSQQQECKLLYLMTADSTATEREFVVNRDTLFFENTRESKLFFINDKVYHNNNVVHSFRKVSWYAEIDHLCIDGATYLYFYPIHHNQAGPYIWELSNG